MKLFYDLIRMLTCLSIICLCSIGSYELIKVEHSTDAVVVKVNQNLDDTHRLILEASLTAMEARKASALELAALPAITQKVTATLDNLNAAGSELHNAIHDLDSNENALTTSSLEVLKSTNTTITAVRPILIETQKSIADLQPIEAHLNNVIDDPDITAILSNTATTTANTAETTKQLSLTSTDVRTAVHEYLNPGWKTKVFNWSMTVVHTLGGWF